MKPLLRISAAVLLFTIIAPHAFSQDNVAAPSKPMHLQRMTPEGNIVQFVAATIVERRDRRQLTSKWETLYHAGRFPLSRPSIIHLEGSVEISIFNSELALHTSTGPLYTKEMILTADEADYDPETGEIQPQGHVSIKFQKVESGAK